MEATGGIVQHQFGHMEAGTGIEPVIEVLQTSALPLGYPAKLVLDCRPSPYHLATWPWYMLSRRTLPYEKC